MRYAAHLALFVSSLALTQGPVSADAPPQVRSVPLTETVHGITLEDEYRWMEDPANQAEMLAFVERENVRTRAMLDALPERAWFLQRLTEISSSLDRIGGGAVCGDTILVKRTGAQDRLAKLYLRRGGQERLFLDPAQVGGSELASFGAVAMSPDCTRASVQVSNAGSEMGTTHIYDIASGREIAAPIERIWGDDPVEFVGKDQLLYTQLLATPIDGDPMRGATAFVAPLDGGEPVAVMGNGMTVAPQNAALVSVRPGQPFAVGTAASARADNAFFVSPTGALLAGKPRWTEVATLDDQVGAAEISGNLLYLLTTKDNGAGSIMRYPLSADGQKGEGEEVLAGAPDLLIKQMRFDVTGLYVLASRDGASRLLYLPGGRGPAREIALPFEGFSFGIDATEDGHGIAFPLTGWTNGVTIFEARGGRLIETGIASQIWDGAAEMTVRRMEATSADGTRVPMVMLRREGALGRTPTIVEAYGGYGFDTVFPAYDRNIMAWLDKGGAVAYCGTRGGGERGREWHEGGRGPSKPRGMEDLAACANALTRAGVAPEQGPLITGASMGGTLVPTAALRDPKPFGAMITGVGVVNASRIGVAENGANQFDEMGNPADPHQFRDLVAMDAYQMIPSAASLPPTMMVIGLNDNRVAPWMTAKWVARARAKWPDAPIYLRGDTRAGHGIGSAEDVRREEIADQYAFAWAAQNGMLVQAAPQEIQDR
ncbi:prolyl oligopeptidase family serine peptidase [Qipengyuania spongiae]|uniref:Prolyl oligopeptidase family serine peptidase n=1 Tax=Qipengyuania spongiae TaxID=2909673 RepID=A0ABY5SYF4_9SPHN|nr:prolyl oligopeptidase family serine peptidase [Qipengyuania spongiae]UVI39572.1 prolyl oligopeptidase family serine peptidase [Qipengyuania spongiae]